MRLVSGSSRIPQLSRQDKLTEDLLEFHEERNIAGDGYTISRRERKEGKEFNSQPVKLCTSGSGRIEWIRVRDADAKSWCGEHQVVVWSASCVPEPGKAVELVSTRP